MYPCTLSVDTHPSLLLASPCQTLTCAKFLCLPDGEHFAANMMSASFMLSVSATRVCQPQASITWQTAAASTPNLNTCTRLGPPGA